MFLWEWRADAFCADVARLFLASLDFSSYISLMSERHETDVVVIGAGPVGLFTVFQLGMLKVKAHVVDALDVIGGQCAALYPEKPIYDIPGFPSIEGQQLVDQLAKQAEPFAPTYHLAQQVIQLEQEGEGWKVLTSAGNEIVAKAVVIAAGCGAFGPNRPPLEGLQAFEERGCVQYLVTQKEKFRDKKVVIAGGGDSAVDWAVLLADIAAQVYVVHRRPKFRAMADTVDKMHALADAGKIEMVIPYQLAGLQGNNGDLDAVIVQDLEGNDRALEADYLLPFFGLAMDLGPIADWGLGLHMSHIQVNPATCETDKKGIFAVGDIATYENKLKLILCGFSEAAMACHTIRDLVYPDTAYHFEYSTSKGVQGAA